MINLDESKTKFDKHYKHYNLTSLEWFDELLRFTRSGGLFVLTIHYKLYKKAGFDKKLLEIKKSITKPSFHEVDVYGNNPDKDHGNDKVIIVVFRKD